MPVQASVNAARRSSVTPLAAASPRAAGRGRRSRPGATKQKKNGVWSAARTKPVFQPQKSTNEKPSAVAVLARGFIATGGMERD